jgi:hypothetical protein
MQQNLRYHASGKADSGRGRAFGPHSLKRSAERSRRRNPDPFRSVESMLTFYINRAGKSLGAAQRRRLEAAEDELRRLYRRPAWPRPARGSGRKKKNAGR